jgi:ATP-binding cassette subfamily B protein
MSAGSGRTGSSGASGAGPGSSGASGAGPGSSGASGAGPGSSGASGALAALHEEETLGRAYDARLLARLWRWVAPQRLEVAATLLLVAPLLLLELAPAWIVKTGLDRVVGGAAAGGQGRLAALLDAPAGVDPLLWLGGLYLVAMLALSSLEFVRGVLMSRTGQAAMRLLRADVFDHLQSLHLGYFDRHPVGRLVTRATNDIENVAEMFSQGIVAFLTDLIKMAGFAVALFLVDAKLALITFCVVPFLAVTAFWFRLKVREAFRLVRVRIARINAFLQETVTGMKVVQLFGREARNARDFDALNAEHRDAWFQSIRYDSALFATVEFAFGVTIALILAWGTGTGRAGLLYVFIDWMRRFFLPLRDLSAKYSVMQSSMASCERIFELLDTQPAIRDPEPGRAPRAAPAPAAGRGEVVFENVWFSYQGEPAGSGAGEGRGGWVLHDVSLRVAAGERVAFVGATGAGKTTVIKLLARLYEPTRGRILLDGVDLRELPQAELRRRLAMVLQDVFLFSGSVAENITLGRPGVGAEEVRRAARAVGADSFVERLPQGFGTILRERGGDLSAGQRQLLSFARALAQGAEVLVLDEATSSVDLETEALVQRGIHALLQGRTAIVIAHRLSTIEDVDRIHVLHHGRIIESGRHDELLAQRGLYHRLHRLQQAAEAPQRRGVAAR